MALKILRIRADIIRELIEAGTTLGGRWAITKNRSRHMGRLTRASAARREAEVADLVAIALLRRGQLLSKLRRREESIAVFDDVVSRYQASEDPRFRIRVATALFHTGIDLAVLNRLEDAMRHLQSGHRALRR